MTSNERFLTGRQVRERYGDISRMTLYRWRQNGKVPQPVQIGGRPMWRLSDLEAQETKQ
ncbi:AlpA family phage regulatory protein [Ensifer sp. NBAIM29]|nr:AlpA family phage regulatory protein [Ensifer sp. NBAIM29]